MAKELLTLRGESTMALSPASLVTRALHTTSDFPIILGDTVGRVLRDAYQAAPSGIRRLGRQTTARDFRAVNKIMLGEAPLLEKLNEHGEIKAGTMAEAREAYKVETWARKIGITRQVLVNDDLGAFSDLARRMGQAAAETEARILVTLLEAGSGNGPDPVGRQDAVPRRSRQQGGHRARRSPTPRSRPPGWRCAPRRASRIARSA